MSGSPKPSAPAGIPGTAVEVEFPRGMFFNALDYAPGALAKAERTATQVKVSGARNQALGNLTRIKDRLGNSLAHLRSADDYGLVTSSMDVLVGLADEFHDAVLKLARLADNAEARYEDYFTKPTAPAAGGFDGPAAVEALQEELQRLGAPAPTVTITMDPVKRHHPASMAEAMQIRNAKLRQLNAGQA